MLNSFRAFSGSITTKILLLVLILSFALWGVGDMLGGTRGSQSLAKVGDKTITTDSYSRKFAEESDQIRRQLGANYSSELLKRLNVPQVVLQRMVQESLLNQEAKRMGFIPDDTSVALEIRKNPAFMNRSGMFDKARFENALRSQTMSEKKYVEQLRMQLATDRLMDALAIDPPIETPMLVALQAAYNQGRAVDLYVLSEKSLPASPPATEAELMAFHREHAELFTAPEFRTASFMRFSVDDAANKDNTVNDETVRSFYNTHEDQFRLPERREVEQLLYNSEDKAREAYAQVKLGKSLADIASATQPVNRGNLSLGVVDKKSLPETAADSVFNLPEGGFTEPLKSPFGWHIFRVAGIAQEGVQPLEKARPAIEAQLKQATHESAITDKMNQIEDALAGGSTLAETAKSMDLAVEQAGTFDKDGNTPQGSTNSQLPKLDKFIEVAFKTDEKTESSVMASKGDVYYVLRVEAITPEKLRPFAEVKSDVARAFEKTRNDKKIADLASLVEKELATGRPAGEIIAAHTLLAATSGSISRDSKDVGGITLPPSLVTNIFTTDLNAMTLPVRDKNGSYLLAHVKALVPQGTASDARELELKKKEITQTMQDEIFQQYLRYLQTLYPVTIHESVFDQLMRNTTDAAR